MGLTSPPPIWAMSLNILFFFFEVTPKEVLVKSLLHGNNTFSVKEALSMARRDCSMVRIDHGYG